MPRPPARDHARSPARNRNCPSYAPRTGTRPTLSAHGTRQPPTSPPPAHGTNRIERFPIRPKPRQPPTHSHQENVYNIKQSAMRGETSEQERLQQHNKATAIQFFRHQKKILIQQKKLLVATANQSCCNNRNKSAMRDATSEKD